MPNFLSLFLIVFLGWVPANGFTDLKGMNIWRLLIHKVSSHTGFQKRCPNLHSYQWHFKVPSLSVALILIPAPPQSKQYRYTIFKKSNREKRAFRGKPQSPTLRALPAESSFPEGKHFYVLNARRERGCVLGCRDTVMNRTDPNQPNKKQTIEKIS